MSFTDLPKELYILIFNHLNAKEISANCRINKRISKIFTKKDVKFWKQYIEQKYGFIQSLESQHEKGCKCGDRHTRWKRFGYWKVSHKIGKILDTIVNSGLLVPRDFFCYYINHIFHTWWQFDHAEIYILGSSDGDAIFCPSERLYNEDGDKCKLYDYDEWLVDQYPIISQFRTLFDAFVLELKKYVKNYDYTLLEEENGQIQEISLVDTDDKEEIDHDDDYEEEEEFNYMDEKIKKYIVEEKLLKQEKVVDYIESIRSIVKKPVEYWVPGPGGAQVQSLPFNSMIVGQLYFNQWGSWYEFYNHIEQQLSAVGVDVYKEYLLTLYKPVLSKNKEKKENKC